MTMPAAGDDANIEQAFQAWAAKHGISNPDAPDRSYNYRGAFLSGVDPDRHGELPEAFRVNRMELGFDPQSGLWREQGSTIGEGPTDPAYDNPGNLQPMELGFDPQTGIWRAIGSVPKETNEERRAREKAKYSTDGLIGSLMGLISTKGSGQ